MKKLNFVFKAIILGALLSSFSIAKDTITIDTPKGKIEVPKNPKKVIVLDYGALDTLDLLGVKVEKLGIAPEVIPSNLKKYEKTAQNVGNLHEPNFEKIYEFKPDFIIVGGRGIKSYDELSKIAPTLLYVANAEHFTKDTMQLAQDLGKIFGKEKEVEVQIKNINNLAEQTKQMASKSNKKVLFLLTNDGSIRAYGKGSRFGFVYTDLGLKQDDLHIKVSTHGQNVNYEYISKENPDVILFVDRTSVVGGSKLGGDTLNNKLVLDTNAGKANKIIPLSSDIWYLSGGGLGAYKTYIKEVQKAFK